jgi:hypothetical protein
MARALTQLTGTGNATTNVPAYLFSVVLTAGSDAATLVVKDGSSGATVLTLKAAANTSVSWTAGSSEGVLMSTAIHATFTGTSPVGSFEYD